MPARSDGFDEPNRRTKSLSPDGILDLEHLLHAHCADFYVFRTPLQFDRAAGGGDYASLLAQ